jgi:hypothetical protein
VAFFLNDLERNPDDTPVVVSEFDEKLGILSEEMAEKHAAENKEIIFKEKDTIIIYPSHIQVPIRIEQNGGLFWSLNLMQPGPILTKIDKLSYDGSLRSLLLSLVVGRKTHYEGISNATKCLYIRSLKVDGYHLYNVIMLLDGNMAYILCAQKKFGFLVNHSIVVQNVVSQEILSIKFYGISFSLPADLASTIHKYQKTAKDIGGEEGRSLEEKILKPIVDLLPSDDKAQLAAMRGA